MKNKNNFIPTAKQLAERSRLFYRKGMARRAETNQGCRNG